MSAKPVDLNVGGVCYSTSASTLCKQPGSLLAQWFADPDRHLAKDSRGRYFIDRDGEIFGHLLNCLRDDCVSLPGQYHCRSRLKQEAAFFGLSSVVSALERGQEAGGGSACITVGYRGTFAFGRDGLADVKFRKLTRILVAGRISLCRQVFGDTLNESRDPDRGEDDRYTSRFFLKHNVLEQAFEMLYDAGYSLEGAAGSGTNSSMTDAKPGQDNEETKWQHYNEFVFVKV